MAAVAACPPLMYPEKFDLALRYGDKMLMKDDSSLSNSDRVLLYALSRQAQDGVNKDPRPSMFDAEAKAKWNAWKEASSAVTR